ncbi:hypothetical protein B9Z65_1289 [Elsinoe australis]|uniref:Uncharacterized protein n=1 Tax=Elsinoe australis TaxID=40998 RepID=A0A2P7YQ49_9PEZI|nr:hypothetical protein B9Z65_1289 [Elsinoe australis]
MRSHVSAQSLLAAFVALGSQLVNAQVSISRPQQNGTDAAPQPTITPAPEACVADCDARPGNAVIVNWIKMSVSETLTAATIVRIIDDNTNITSTKTIYADLPTGVSVPPTASDGRRIQVLTYPVISTTLGDCTSTWSSRKVRCDASFTIATMTYPDSFWGLPKGFALNGTLPTTAADGASTCISAPSTTWINFPTGSPSPTPTPGTTDSDDPLGYLWTTLEGAFYAQSSWYSAYPGEAAFTSCSSYAIPAPVSALFTASLVTITSESRIAATAAPSPSPSEQTTSFGKTRVPETALRPTGSSLDTPVFETPIAQPVQPSNTEPQPVNGPIQTSAPAANPTPQPTTTTRVGGGGGGGRPPPIPIEESPAPGPIQTPTEVSIPPVASSPVTMVPGGGQLQTPTPSPQPAQPAPVQNGNGQSNPPDVGGNIISIILGGGRPSPTTAPSPVQQAPAPVPTGQSSSGQQGAQPVAGQPGQGQQGSQPVQPAQGQPAQGQSAQGQPAQGQSAQGQPVQGQTSNTTPSSPNVGSNLISIIANQGRPAPTTPASAANGNSNNNDFPNVNPVSPNSPSQPNSPSNQNTSPSSPNSPSAQNPAQGVTQGTTPSQPDPPNQGTGQNPALPPYAQPTPSPILIAGLPFTPTTSSQFVAPNGQTFSAGQTVYVGTAESPTPVVLTTNKAGSTVFVAGREGQGQSRTTVTVPSAPTLGVAGNIVAALGGTPGVNGGAGTTATATGTEGAKGAAVTGSATGSAGVGGTGSAGAGSAQTTGGADGNGSGSQGQNGQGGATGAGGATGTGTTTGGATGTGGVPGPTASSATGVFPSSSDAERTMGVGSGFALVMLGIAAVVMF